MAAVGLGMEPASTSLCPFPSTGLPVVEKTLGVHSARFLYGFSEKFGHLKMEA